MKNVYIVGICGTAMASLAGLLKSKGYNVVGSDTNAYPPMSDMLNSLGIEIKLGYKRENLESLNKIDFAIIGNVVKRDNVESQYIIERGIEYYSMPSFMERFILPSYKTLVVAGTHGKSSTTSMLASTLECLGENPSFLVGAIPLNFGVSFRLTDGNYFVIEGDEYDTAFFDKVPKFLHYLPYSAIITSIEYDHADIYNNFEEYKEQFVKLARIVDSDGILVLKDDEVIRDIIKIEGLRRVFYGNRMESDAYILNISHTKNYMEVSAVLDKREFRYILSVYGYQNALNSLSVITLLVKLGFKLEDVIKGIGEYRGVKRRMEFVGDFGGIGVVDDFAHHPTAVRITIDAVRKAYIETGRYRRLISIFEPRSNTSRRNIFFEEYSRAFCNSDVVIMAKPYEKNDNLKDELNVNGVLQNLSKYGIKVFSGGKKGELLNLIRENSNVGDLLLFMSNGDFGNLVKETVTLLKGDT